MANARDNYSPLEHAILYKETGGTCPLCNDPLSETKKGSVKPIKNYELAHIYPLNPNAIQKKALVGYAPPAAINGLSNLMALCVKCHTRYDKDFKIEEYKALQKIKDDFIKATAAQNTLSTYHIEEEIYGLIEEIANFGSTIAASPGQNFDPLTVDGKIGNGMKPLKLSSIKHNVSEYYVRIRDRFKLMEQADQIVVRQIETEVRAYYFEMLKLSKNDKAKIFDNIAEWFHKKSGKSHDACIVLTSFFVQNCEVFDASTQ